MRATLLWMAALALAALVASSGAAHAEINSPVADSCPEPLYCGTLEDTEAYRFRWAYALVDRYIAVRVFRRGDDYGLAAVVLEGGGGYKPVNVSRRVTKALSPAQWRTLIAGLEELQFWRMATHSSLPPGVDGVTLMVEGRYDGRYHEVIRWMGTDGLKSLGRLFLDFAGLGDLGPVY